MVDRSWFVEQQLEGVWFLATSRDLRAPGVVQCDPRVGLSLRVSGRLVNRDEIGPCTFHGITSSGTYATLLSCYLRRSGVALSKDQPIHQEFLVARVVHGMWTSEDGVDLRAEFKIDGIDSWCAQPSVRLKVGKRGSFAVSGSLRQKALKTWGDVSDEIRELKLQPRVSISNDRFDSTVAERKSVTLRLTRRAPHRVLVDHAWWFTKLVSLFHMERLTIHELAVRPYRKPRDAPWPYFVAKPTYPTPRKRIDESFIPFSFSMVRDHLDSAVPIWFRERAKFEEAVNLLLETWKDGVVGEFRLLALTQALEALHRRAGGAIGQYVSDDDFEKYNRKIVAAIPDEVPPELRSSLKARLKYGNEFSQRKRFKQLVRQLPRTMGSAFPPKPTDWVDRVVERRNLLTHYPTEPAPTWSGRRTLLENSSLTVLLMFHLLRGLGLPDEVVEAGLRRSTAWRLAIRSRD